MTCVFIPGFGFTSALSEMLPMPCIGLNYQQYSLYEELDDLLQHYHTIIPKNATMIAWSLGGLLAILFCARFNTHCNKLILLASTPAFIQNDDWPGISLESAMATYQCLQHNTASRFLSLVTYPHCSRSFIKKLNYYFSMPSLQDVQFLYQTDLRELFSQLELPIELYLAEHDAILPSQQLMPACLALNDQCKVTLIKNGSHAFFLQQPEFFKEMHIT